MASSARLGASIRRLSSLSQSLRSTNGLLRAGQANKAMLSRCARSFHLTAPRAALYANPDAETFKKVVETKDRIVLVDFYADWCGPCRQLSPLIEKLTTEPNTSGSGLPLDLVKVDTDSEEGSVIGARFKVSALPTVIAFLNGAPVTQFQGAIPEASLKKFIDQL